MAAAPPGLAPLDAAMAGMNEFVAVIGERHEFAARRRRIIDTNPELRERDLIKNAEMAATLAKALRDYGLDEETATLAAEAAIGAFRVAWDRWTATAKETRPTRRPDRRVAGAPEGGHRRGVSHRLRRGRRRTGLMRAEGLEPPRPFGHQDLNLARIPIPPRPPGAARTRA